MHYEESLSILFDMLAFISLTSLCFLGAVLEEDADAVECVIEACRWLDWWSIAHMPFVREGQQMGQRATSTS